MHHSVRLNVVRTELRLFNSNQDRHCNGCLVTSEPQKMHVCVWSGEREMGLYHSVISYTINCEKKFLRRKLEINTHIHSLSLSLPLPLSLVLSPLSL